MKNMTKTQQIVFMGAIFTDGVIFDQVSKVLLDMSLKEPLVIIEGLFNLHIEHNPGIAFSINLPYYLLLFLNIVLFGGIVFYLLKNLNLKRFLSIFTIALLSAGAMGNLIDRIRLGYVIDFISVGSFPVFNLADSFITIAIFLLLLFYDRIRRPN